MDPLRAARRCLAVDGEFWECGVWRGGCAAHMATMLTAHPRPLRLFDTFSGLPPRGPHDVGASSSAFTDTSLAFVQSRVVAPFVSFHPGVIPESFAGLESAQIAFAYVDLDLYQSTMDALTFIWPRMVSGGIVLVDDYDAPDMWPGAGIAVDEFIRRYGVSMQVSERRAVLRA